jgi:hypothetical protein
MTARSFFFAETLSVKRLRPQGAHPKRTESRHEGLVTGARVVVRHKSSRANRAAFF